MVAGSAAASDRVLKLPGVEAGVCAVPEMVMSQRTMDLDFGCLRDYAYKGFD